MQHLVINHNGTLATTQTSISSLTENKEKSIQDLILKNLNDLSEFGNVDFIETKTTGRSKKTYYLNEQQATLLLTYMKNTQTVRNAKKALVKEFFRLRELEYQKMVPPTVPPTQLELITPYEVRRDLATARRLLTLEKQKHRKSVETLEATIEELKEEKQSLKKVDGMYDVGLVDSWTANLVAIQKDLSKEDSKKLTMYALDLDAGAEVEPIPLIQKHFISFMYEASRMKDDIQALMHRCKGDYVFVHMELYRRHDMMNQFLHNMREAYGDFTFTTPPQVQAIGYTERGES